MNKNIKALRTLPCPTPCKFFNKLEFAPQNDTRYVL